MIKFNTKPDINGKVIDGVIVKCDSCGMEMDEDGECAVDGAVFYDGADAEIYMEDYGWNRLAIRYARNVLKKIRRGELELHFVKHGDCSRVRKVRTES